MKNTKSNLERNFQERYFSGATALYALPKHAESSWGSLNTRKLLIGGNWKCNGDKDFVWFPYMILQSVMFDPNLLDVIVAPGYLYLWKAKNLIYNEV